MHYIGLMSGTSVDAIDAVLVSIPPEGGFALLETHQHALPDPVGTAIQALMQPGAGEIDREGELDMQLGQLFAKAANALLKKSGIAATHIRAIGSHGQTIRHRPHATHAFTRQIGNPSVIAEQTGITTVADFRARDMAAGGQGAPLVPAFHAARFQKDGTSRAIVNIGGIANITWLAGDAQVNVIGFDTGPGNTLLDQWAQKQLGRSYDHNGAWASGGNVLPKLLSGLLGDAYFRHHPPKSTGRELFHLEWLARHLAGSEAPQDVQATLAELSARSIAEALQKLLPAAPQEVYVCGGGAHNHDLLARLRAALGNIPVETTAALGLEADWVEASAFAWLAHQTMGGHTGNLPSVTGARRPVVLGGIYLG